ncbi:PIN domain-containing protein [Streptomyces sp. NPDC059271]|uniref:PIN domain-containing protein n=1 Tax=Streptomyces sp. NPDC059271 TaxID=3346799 RepID=UPI003699DFB8
MIALDTNQLRHAAFPHGPILGMLRKIAEVHQRALVLPEMVAVEHVAHHKHDIEQALGAARRALTVLEGTFGQDLVSSLGSLTGHDAAEMRRQQLESVFQILPTPAGAAEEALRREANRLPPAEQTWSTNDGKPVKARGARDSVIWLTLLAAAKATGHDLWFVSQDQDFGKDDFHPALRQEARARLVGDDQRLRLLSGGVDQLLSELADPGTVPQDLPKSLQSPVVAHAVNIAIKNANLFMGLLPPRPAGTDWLSSGITLEELTVKRSKAYTVGDALWVSAHVHCRAAKIYNFAYADGQVGVNLTPQTVKAPVKFEAALLLEFDGAALRSAEVVSHGAIFAQQPGDPANEWTVFPRRVSIELPSWQEL